MFKVVIVGAGPAGYCAALRFKHAGLDVTLVDSRVGQYTRPGALSAKTIQILTQELRCIFPQKYRADSMPLQKLDTNGNSLLFQIKDLERALSEHAKELGIPIIPMNVKGMKENTLIFDDGDELAADLIIDATGYKRAIISFMNAQALEKQTPQLPFEEKTVPLPSLNSDPDSVLNPAPNNLIAYVKIHIPGKDFSFKSDKDLLIEKKKEAVDSLQKKFNWIHKGTPYFNAMPVGKDKFVVYMEAPNDLTEANKTEWLEDICKLYIAEDVKLEYLPLSKKYGEKKVHIRTFTVALNQVNPYYKANNFCVLPVGDALCKTDYRKGLSLSMTIAKIAALLSSGITKEGMSSFRFSEYEQKLNAIDSYYLPFIAKFYADRTLALKGGESDLDLSKRAKAKMIPLPFNPLSNDVRKESAITGKRPLRRCQTVTSNLDEMGLNYNDKAEMDMEYIDKDMLFKGNPYKKIGTKFLQSMPGSKGAVALQNDSVNEKAIEENKAHLRAKKNHFKTLFHKDLPENQGTPSEGFFGNNM
ncbi:MAG: FAD-dependent oxidoreductase [Legionella sp.]|nr:FAD-dependent oxidoreductase [Legionella sp.]